MINIGHKNLPIIIGPCTRYSELTIEFIDVAFYIFLIGKIRENLRNDPRKMGK